MMDVKDYVETVQNAVESKQEIEKVIEKTQKY